MASHFQRALHNVIKMIWFYSDFELQNLNLAPICGFKSNGLATVGLPSVRVPTLCHSRSGCHGGRQGPAGDLGEPGPGAEQRADARWGYQKNRKLKNPGFVFHQIFNN